MDIETWLGISIFLNFCFGVEDLYRRRHQIKKFMSQIKNKKNN